MMLRPPLNARLPRTLRDAARDPFDYVEHYRAPLADRLLHWWRPVSWLLFWATWAALGVLLAIRG